jgi:hypothetical protein
MRVGLIAVDWTGHSNGSRAGLHVPSCVMARRSGTQYALWPLASSGWHTCSMQAFLAALVGGLLTIVGGIAAVLATGRGVRSQWRIDTQRKVSTEVLSALQKLVRHINDIAYLADKQSDDAEKAWSAYGAAVTEWNSARHAALLVSPPKIVALLQHLDKEADWLVDRAMTKQWSKDAFRKERNRLGQLAADYLDAGRVETGWPPLHLKSLWEWTPQKKVQPPIPNNSPND